jgi:hypothetical protein
MVPGLTLKTVAPNNALDTLAVLLAWADASSFGLRSEAIGAGLELLFTGGLFDSICTCSRRRLSLR